MPNRDQERSRYNEGRSDGEDFRDQSNRGSRDWDRQGEEFRTQGYDRRDERLDSRGTGYGGGAPYGHDERSFSQRYPVSDWRDDHTFAQRDDQRFTQRAGSSREWNRAVGYHNPEQSSYGRDWGHARSGSFGPERDYGRELGPSYRSQYGRDESFGAQTSGDSPYFGPRREEWAQRSHGVGRSDWGSEQHRHDDGRHRQQHDENWGQQLREGVQQVANRVKRVFRGPKNYKRSDERIREDVSDRLAQQYDVDPTDIEVLVSSGEVTLTGTVQTRREKFLAEEIADDVGGVSEVHNQLRVRREGAQSSASPLSTSVTSSSEGSRNGNTPRA